MMLCSLVLTLKAVRDTRYTHFTGRGTHGFWLKSWRAIDPPVGDWLHARRWDQPIGGEPFAAAAPNPAERIAPYCVSPLMGLPEPNEAQMQHIPAGWNAWLRVAGLHPHLARRMVEGPCAWIDRAPERISIDGAEWFVTARTVDPARHEWAALSSYETLRGAALDGGAPPRRWAVGFETPTLIRGAGAAGQVGDLLFPLPDRLLESWRRGWNAYAGLETAGQAWEISEGVVEQARESLRAVRYRLQTRTACFQYNAERAGKAPVVVPVTGCVGEVIYESFAPPAVRALEDLLFRYAFFRGAGYHTTQGLGMTHSLPAAP